MTCSAVVFYGTQRKQSVIPSFQRDDHSNLFRVQRHSSRAVLDVHSVGKRVAGEGSV